MIELKHISLPDAVGRTLRSRILNAEIPAGTRLVETQLADEFGVSRTTIRQALRDLRNEGLVILEPRRHCVVTRMSVETARDVCFARYTLESGAVREWLRRRGATDDDLDIDRGLRVAIKAMEAAAADNDTLAVVEADTAFHGVLIDGGHRQRLAALWHTLDAQMGALIGSELERQHSNLGEVAARHTKLAQAVASRNGDQIEAALIEHYVF
jgi:DNA-binding GntR family transcriptional regulator